MGNEMIVIIVESVVIFVMAVVIVILGMKLSRKPKGKADNVIIKDGVRYTREENETTADGGVKITHRENDVILEKGVNYVVEKGGKVIHLENRLDPSLRGGICVALKDRRYDGSLKEKARLLKKHLMKGDIYGKTR